MGLDALTRRLWTTMVKTLAHKARPRLRRSDLPIVGIGAILFLAFLLRWKNLGTRNLWFDEAWSWYVSQQPVRFILQEGRDNIHPPLLHLVLKGWTALFGQSPSTVRMPSLLASVLIVGLTYRLGRELLSRRAAMLAALLLALSPHQVFYAQEARMYVLVTALTLGAVLGAVSFLRRAGMIETPPDSAAGSAIGGRAGGLAAFAYILCGTLALYTHVFSALVVATMNLYVLGLLLIRSRHALASSLAARRASLLRRWGAWQLGLLALYAPWIPTFFYQVFSRPRQGWRLPLELTTLGGEAVLFLGKMLVGSFVYPQGVYYAVRNLFEYRWTGEMILTALTQLALYPLAIGLGFFLLVRGVRAVRWTNPVPALFFVPLLLICGMLAVIRQHMDFGRYLFLITPYYFLLLAAGLLSLRTPWQRGVMLGLVMLPMSLGLREHYRAPAFDSDYRPVAAILRRAWQKGDQILVDPAYVDRCLRYELRETPIPDALPSPILPPTPLLDHLRDVRSSRVWIVLDYRSPWFRRFPSRAEEAIERAPFNPLSALDRWSVEQDQLFPPHDPRVRVILLVRRGS